MAGQNYFSKIFGDSPVTPLQNHIDKVVFCVEQLIPYFEAVYTNNWEQAAIVQNELSNIEHEADNIKNEIRMHLPSSLFMPVDRRDVLEVLDLQDNIANKAKDISGLILGRKMAMPEALHDTYLKFLTRCIDATKQTQVAINQLDELVVSGFRGDEVTRVKAMIAELHVIEDDTDDIQIGLRAQLYALEAELPPIDVMFIYEIIKWTGDLADTAQSTGNRLQLMLAK
ncbi:MAG: putative phosphate transport protein (TIGR00153 family) [Planctomycetota bacterium]|jgi:predicted phosphate transport protein (TIGR00153 family)